MKEIWKPLYLENQLTGYDVSDMGNVRDRSTYEILNFHLSDKGYCRIHLRKSKLPDCVKSREYLIHRLVLMAFVPIDNPDEMTGDHRDKNKLNNRLTNLRWLTREDNSRESHKFGRVYGKGMESNHRVYDLDQILSVCELLEQDEKSIPEISELTNVSKDTIQKIKSRKQWVNISCDFDFPEVRSNVDVKTYSREEKEKIVLYIISHPYDHTIQIMNGLNLNCDNRTRMLIARVRNDMSAGKYDDIIMKFNDYQKLDNHIDRNI